MHVCMYACMYVCISDSDEFHNNRRDSTNSMRGSNVYQPSPPSSGTFSDLTKVAEKIQAFSNATQKVTF